MKDFPEFLPVQTVLLPSRAELLERVSRARTTCLVLFVVALAGWVVAGVLVVLR
jgi:hypothetical protein